MKTEMLALLSDRFSGRFFQLDAEGEDRYWLIDLGMYGSPETRAKFRVPEVPGFFVNQVPDEEIARKIARFSHHAVIDWRAIDDIITREKAKIERRIDRITEPDSARPNLHKGKTDPDPLLLETSGQYAERLGITTPAEMTAWEEKMRAALPKRTDMYAAIGGFFTGIVGQVNSGTIDRENQMRWYIKSESRAAIQKNLIAGTHYTEVDGEMRLICQGDDAASATAVFLDGLKRDGRAYHAADSAYPTHVHLDMYDPALKVLLEDPEKRAELLVVMAGRQSDVTLAGQAGSGVPPGTLLR